MFMKYLTTFMLTVIINNLIKPCFSLTCFQKHFDSHEINDVPSTANCTSGLCRLMGDERDTFPFLDIQQDCVEGLNTSEVGCRNETRSKSMVCFCDQDYCNSLQNISKSSITKKVLPDISCYMGDLDAKDKETCEGPYCNAWQRVEYSTNTTTFIRGMCFSQGLFNHEHPFGEWFTKYELMFQHWPYGRKSGTACGVVDRIFLGKRYRDTICICTEPYCNVKEILKPVKPKNASKIVQCFLGEENKKMKATDVCYGGQKCFCWGEYCLLHHVKPLGYGGFIKRYKYKSCLNVSVEQDIGVIETLDYFQKTCKEDLCNEDGDPVSSQGKRCFGKLFFWFTLFYLLFGFLGSFDH